MELLRLLLLAVNKWLELRCFRERWTLQQDIARYVDDIENQIMRARSAGDDLLADRLLQRLSAATCTPIPTGDIGVVRRADLPSPAAGAVAQPTTLSGAGGGAPGRAQGIK